MCYIFEQLAAGNHKRPNYFDLRCNSRLWLGCRNKTGRFFSTYLPFPSLGWNGCFFWISPSPQKERAGWVMFLFSRLSMVSTRTIFCLNISESVFFESEFSKVYFWKVYFSKVYFPKVYFLKCIFPKCIYPKCIFAKCTRLACLLSFASLFFFIILVSILNC